MNKQYICVGIAWVIIVLIAILSKSKVFFELLPIFGVMTFIYLIYATIRVVSAPKVPTTKK